MKNKIQALFMALVVFSGAIHMLAQGTTFTYQGQLKVNGSLANGNYDLNFILLNAPTNGTVFGSLTNSATPVNNGLFTAKLDFGGVFNGSNYWLQIATRTNGYSLFTALTPLQPIAPTPYAVYAENAASATTALTAGTATSANSVAGQNISGSLGLAQLPAAVLTNSQTGVTLGGNLTGYFVGNGTGLTNLSAGNLIGMVSDSILSSNIVRVSLINTNVQATAIPLITAGFIIDTTNLSGGFGYTNNPLVTVSDSTGSNALIIATVANGSVTSLSVQSAGSHYSAAAIITIAPPPTSAYQIINAITLLNNPNNILWGSFTGNGAGLTNVNLTGLSASSVLGNLADGYQALASNTTGNDNTADGYQALMNNTSGSGNTANGYQTLLKNTTGGSDSAFGIQALQNNTTGSDNTAVGHIALLYNTIGGNNTAVGAVALMWNTTGSANTAIGKWAMWQNISGNNNTASGYTALQDNSSGGNNTANGAGALLNNTTGNYNTANGVDAIFANINGTENAANGAYSLYSNTNGSYNTGNGQDALHYNTSGSNNTANGFQSLFHNLTGSYNTANGVNAFYSISSGSYNIADGYQAGYNITTGSSNIDIGNQGVASDTNIIRIGSGQTQAFIAGVITGNGSGLSNLSPASLVSGTAAINISGNAATATTASTIIGNVADNQLSANVPLLNTTNSFTGPLIATNSNNVFRGSGAGLVNIPASSITGGVTTNLLIGGRTFYITNGIIMAVQ